MRGLATRRARWNPRLPLAVGAVVVLGAALPAALAVGGGTMLDDGVRSAVAAAGPGDRGTQVSARLDDADPAAQDRAAREVVGRVFEGVPATTWTGLRSGNLPLTGLPASPAGEIRLVAEVLPDAAAHAELVTGRWPDAAPGAAAAGAPIPAALHAGAARTLGIATGDRLTLGTPGTPAARTVDVVGLWQVPDAADPYWFGDPLELTGAERDTVRGPLLVAAGPDGTPPDVGDRWSARWRTVVDPAGLEAGDAERLARRLARLETEVEAIPTAGGGVARTAGGLAETLAYPRLAVPLARSATVAVLVLVVGLAALVAAQAAALLAADRGRESGVIRARGASRLQLARLTTVELLAVAAVAVVPAALLAIATLASPLGPAGGRAGPVALAAALGCLALALVVSAGVQVLLARSHAPRAPAAPRATVDLALAAALGLALWQVWAAPRGGGTAPGAATLDPVLVVAPAVALGAAGVLVVRALGPPGRVLGRLARRDGAVAGPRRLARGPPRHPAGRAAGGAGRRRRARRRRPVRARHRRARHARPDGGRVRRGRRRHPLHPEAPGGRRRWRVRDAGRRPRRRLGRGGRAGPRGRRRRAARRHPPGRPLGAHRGRRARPGGRRAWRPPAAARRHPEPHRGDGDHGGPPAGGSGGRRRAGGRAGATARHGVPGRGRRHPADAPPAGPARRRPVAHAHRTAAAWTWPAAPACWDSRSTSR